METVGTDDFFRSINEMPPHEALQALAKYREQFKAQEKEFQSKLLLTPRGEKQAAREIINDLRQIQQVLKRFKPVMIHYTQLVERENRHSYWVDAVREVCGDEKLSEVYAHMKRRKKSKKD